MLSGHEGFTLIEIVMVLVLLGILAAIAAAKFFDLSDAAERAAARYSAAEAQARLESTFGQKLLEGMPCAEARTYASNLKYLADDDNNLFGDFRFQAADEQDGTQALTFCRDDDGCSDWKDLDYRLILPVCMEGEGGTSGNGNSSGSGTGAPEQPTVPEQPTDPKLNIYDEFLKKGESNKSSGEQEIDDITYKWWTNSNGNSDNKRTFTAISGGFEVEIISKGNDHTPNEVYIKDIPNDDTSNNLLQSPKQKDKENQKRYISIFIDNFKALAAQFTVIGDKEKLNPISQAPNT